MCGSVRYKLDSLPFPFLLCATVDARCSPVHLTPRRTLGVDLTPRRTPGVHLTPRRTLRVHLTSRRTLGVDLTPRRTLGVDLTPHRTPGVHLTPRQTLGILLPPNSLLVSQYTYKHGSNAQLATVFCTSLVPRLLFAKRENSMVNCLYRFWFQYFEITMTSCQLDCEFKNALVNSELQDSLLVLLLKDIIA